MFSEVVLGIKSLTSTDGKRATISSDVISCNILFDIFFQIPQF